LGVIFTAVVLRLWHNAILTPLRFAEGRKLKFDGVAGGARGKSIGFVLC